MVMIDVGDLKMAREALCRAESAILYLKAYDAQQAEASRIGRMIAQIDALRPTGPDGKHGNLHTMDCGCELTHACPVCGAEGTESCYDQTEWIEGAPLSPSPRDRPHMERVVVNVI